MRNLDLLELELRRIPHVAFIGFDDSHDSLHVQVFALASSDPASVRFQAERICRVHLDQPYAIEIAGGTRPSRIRLLEVHLREGVDDEIEVHLGFESLRTIGRAKGTDPTAAASATFDALHGLGATVPFHVEAAALFEHVLGRA